MGFKLKYKNINQGIFTVALDKLADVGKLPVKIAYNIGKIQKCVLDELKIGQKIYMDLVEKYAEKDEKGVTQKHENGFPKIKSDTAPALEKEVEEMMEIEFEVPFHKISMQTLGNAGLSGKELTALEPILVSFELIEGEPDTHEAATSPKSV